MGAIQPSRFLTDAGTIRPGVRRIIKVGTPAAGAQWSVKIPAGVQWRISMGYALFTTDATVANRTVGAQITVENTTVWQVAAPGTQAASNAFPYNFQSEQGVGTAGSTAFSAVLPLPNTPMPDGAVLSSQVTNMDAGDQWSVIALYIEEYYFTNAQLSEIEREIQHAEYVLERYEMQQAAQAGGRY